jgi:hypothetical protein
MITRASTIAADAGNSFRVLPGQHGCQRSLGYESAAAIQRDSLFASRDLCEKAAA